MLRVSLQQRRGAEIRSEPKATLDQTNKKEGCDLAGKKLKTLDDFIETARSLSTCYQTAVILSLRAEGAIAATDGKFLHVRPPQLTIQSSVGSVIPCWEDAVQYGVVAGTANALRLGTGIFTLAGFEQVLPNVTIETF